MADWRAYRVVKGLAMSVTMFDLNDIEKRMRGSLDALKRELAGLRTGRASAHLLDPVQVSVYGSKMPLNQVATITVPEARMISVQVWDRSNIQAVGQGHPRGQPRRQPRRGRRPSSAFRSRPPRPSGARS